MKRLILLLIIGRILTFFLPILFWVFVAFVTKKPELAHTSWTNWDAPHFLYLAEHGYTPFGDEANFIVFPPLYPLTVKLFAILFRNYEVAAIVVSNTAFILGGVIFYRLIAELYDKKTAWMSLFLLHIFPTSYFFSAPYTESLFFLLTVSSLWFAHRRLWFAAGAFGGFAFLTRHPGVFLLPALFIFAIHEKKKILTFLEIATPFCLCISGYLALNWIVYTDPFAFQHILANHWYKTLAWPWVGLRGSWITARGGWLTNEHSRMIGVAEAISATISLIFIPFIWKVLKRAELALWYTLTVLFLCSTNFLLSTPRYLLSLFPLVLFFALVGKRFPIFYYLWIFISASLWSYFTLIWVHGMWAF